MDILLGRHVSRSYLRSVSVLSKIRLNQDSSKKPKVGNILAGCEKSAFHAQSIFCSASNIDGLVACYDPSVTRFQVSSPFVVVQSPINPNVSVAGSLSVAVVGGPSAPPRP
ncbi:hypothetical protein RIF29_09516 [Crotalaria pallida]|uniref:Uncharacterized protein n=1 Tax=Crotalaria pallida TaxID=3830 RepID=A0AAN9FRY6_CROPI